MLSTYVALHKCLLAGWLNRRMRWIEKEREWDYRYTAYVGSILLLLLFLNFFLIEQNSKILGSYSGTCLSCLIALKYGYN